MATYAVTDEQLTAIADEIRLKLDLVSEITVDEMPGRIRAIDGGGVEPSEQAIQGYFVINPETPKVLTSYRLKIFVPEGIEEVGYMSLGNDSRIVEVELPSTLISFNTNVFYGATRLTKITCKAINPPVIAMANAFDGVPADCAIYVPAESVDAYKAANIWSTRSAYIQAIPE